MLSQIDKPKPHGYAWEMPEYGWEFEVVPHISGHSFRKGGANALRDALLAQGKSQDDVVAYLMKFGRWKSEASLRHYLAFKWEQLAIAAAALRRP